MRLQTSYVPSDTVHKLIVGSLKSGFQSSRLVSNSGAKRMQKPLKRALHTSEPELQAEMMVLSNVTTRASRVSVESTWWLTYTEKREKRHFPWIHTHGLVQSTLQKVMWLKLSWRLYQADHLHRWCKWYYDPFTHCILLYQTPKIHLFEVIYFRWFSKFISK